MSLEVKIGRLDLRGRPFFLAKGERGSEFFMTNNQHVVPHQGDWAVRGEGNSRVTSIFETQSEAIDAARSIAINQRSEVVIHGRNGEIRDKDSYGNDPYPPKDTKN
jgi:hypothetical protein